MKRVFLILSFLLLLFYVGVSSGVAVVQGDRLTVYFIDVGEGDSVLVQVHDKNMLIDAGDMEHGAGVVSFLKSNNVSQIDVLVASNPCDEHVGGMKAVLDNFTVKQVWDAGLSYNSEAYKDFIDIVNRKNISYVVAERGQSIDLDPSVRIDVLSPPKQRFGSDPKNNSIVLKLTNGSFSVLFMSDAGFSVENSLLAQSRYSLESSVLKVGDHGSMNSSSLEFRKAVKPYISVISAGKNNGGNYTEGFMGRVLRTYEEGTFTFTSNGTDYWSLHVERQLPSIPPPPPTSTPVSSSLPTSTPVASPFLPVFVAVLVFIAILVLIKCKR